MEHSGFYLPDEKQKKTPIPVSKASDKYDQLFLSHRLRGG
jgi:hypothetical protein